MVDAIARVIERNQALVNITHKRKNGEMADPVSYDATDGDIRGWVSESIRHGYIRGIDADPTVNLTDYVIERFPIEAGVRDHNLIMVRPKTEFG